MNMPLSEDEKKYFEEKFNNLESKIDVALQYGPKITELQVEMQRRPTTLQVISACAFFLGLGITMGSAVI